MTKSLNQNWLDVNIQPRAREREGANEPISTEKRKSQNVIPDHLPEISNKNNPKVTYTAYYIGLK